MGFFEWGGKRFARGVSKSMAHSYESFRNRYPNLTEHELVLRTLSTRPGDPAKTLCSDIENEDSFNKLGGNLSGITYILLQMEYLKDIGGTVEDLETLNPIFKSVLAEVMPTQY